MDGEKKASQDAGFLGKLRCQPKTRARPGRFSKERLEMRSRREEAPQQQAVVVFWRCWQLKCFTASPPSLRSSSEGWHPRLQAELGN